MKDFDLVISSVPGFLVFCMLQGMIPHKGICPPEFIGQTEGYFEDLLEEYRKRQIHLQETVTRRPLNVD